MDKCHWQSIYQDTLYCAMWLLVVTLMQNYKEKEQTGQRFKNAPFEEKVSGSPIELSFLLKKMKMFKEKSNAKWNKGSGKFRTGPHTAKFPICAKEL